MSPSVLQKFDTLSNAGLSLQQLLWASDGSNASLRATAPCSDDVMTAHCKHLSSDHVRLSYLLNYCHVITVNFHSYTAQSTLQISTHCEPWPRSATGLGAQVRRNQTQRTSVRVRTCLWMGWGARMLNIQVPMSDEGPHGEVKWKTNK